MRNQKVRLGLRSEPAAVQTSHLHAPRGTEPGPRLTDSDSQRTHTHTNTHTHTPAPLQGSHTENLWRAHTVVRISISINLRLIPSRFIRGYVPLHDQTLPPFPDLIKLFSDSHKTQYENVPVVYDGNRN